jgi:putative flippase GtrA
MKQFIKFGIVGASNTLIFLAVYYLLIFLGLHYIAANIVGFFISVCNAYYWNSRKVFKRDGSKKAIFRTFAAYGATTLLSTGLMFIMVDIIGISQYIAPLINLCITIPVNFALNKFWVFAK